ncbi:MAG: hypothetical protein WA956_11485 [Stenotrophomonas sp.]
MARQFRLHCKSAPNGHKGLQASAIDTDKIFQRQHCLRNVHMPKNNQQIGDNDGQSFASIANNPAVPKGIRPWNRQQAWAQESALPGSGNR